MKKIDLKACPHCGGEKLRIDECGIYEYSTDEKPVSYWAVCLTCFATGGRGEPKMKPPKIGIDARHKNFV